MKALLTLFFFISCIHFAIGAPIIGSVTATAGQNGVTYSYNDGIVYASFTWFLSNGNGIVMTQTRSGTIHSCTIDWKTAGSSTLTFSGYGSQKGTLNITVNCPTIAVPTATFAYPNGTSACGNVSITYTASPPTGITWYWQSSATAVSTTNSTKTFSATSNGTYYLRAKCLNTWSGAKATSAVTVKTIPTVNATDVSICSGTGTNLVLTNNLPSTTNTWTVTSSNVTGASNSNGISSSSPPYTYTLNQVLAASSNVNGSAVYTITPSAAGCTGTATLKTVTVKPKPSATAAGQTVCSGTTTAINLTTNGVSGATYTWTVNQTNVTGATTPGSSATSTNQTLTNSGVVTGSAGYSIVPAASGCTGTTLLVTVAVNPNPTIILNNLAPTFCSGAPTNISFSSAVPATTFTWAIVPSNVTGAQAAISPVSSGTISQLLSSQDGLTSGSVAYNLQSSATFVNGGMCTATGTANVTVKPKPVASALNTTFFNGSPTSVPLSSSISGSTFTYSVSAVTNITGSSSGSSSPIAQPLALTGINNQGTVTYAVTPTFNGCVGTSANTVVSIYPKPVITSSAPSVYMGSTPTLTAQSLYDTYSWSSSTGSIPGNVNFISVSKPSTYSLAVIKNGISSPNVATIVITGQFDGQNMNYLISNSLQTAISDSARIKFLPVDSVIQAVQYFDGLGRSIQSVVTQGSPSKLDFVLTSTYDAYGKKTKSYLPFTSGENGRYKEDPIGEVSGYDSSAQYDFYNNLTADKIADDVRPFGETVFEASEVNLSIKEYGPGNDWGPTANNKYIQHAYLLNANGTTAGKEQIIAWKIDAATGLPIRDLTSNTFLASGYFKDGQVSINSTKDEQLTEVRAYTDKSGQLILKKVQFAGTPTLNNPDHWAQTYYIYDDLERLVFVLQPELSKTMQASGTANPTALQLANYAFRYKYDGRNRIIEKQIPGAEPVYLIYDNRDRLVMTQDGNQRNAATGKEWIFTKYDAFNRPVLTGKFISNNDRTAMQTAVGNYYANLTGGQAFFESYVGASGVVLGYSNNSFPSSSSESDYYTATYYDGYDSYLAPTGYLYASDLLPGQEPSAITKVTGLAVGSLIKNLSSGAWMRTVMYYDNKYRVIQSISDHQKGTTKASNVYDFAGKLLISKRTYVVNSSSKSIKETYAYDHAGRVLNLKHSIDGAVPEVMLVKNEYNELGQLVDKKLHSIDGGVSFKQSVDQRYNIRGWLTKINEADVSTVAEGDAAVDYFGMELFYNNAVNGISSAQAYNGNISAIQWSKGNGGSVAKQAYNFSYDRLNRLLDAHHFDYKTSGWVSNNKAYQERILEYDLNGNIKKLSRRHFGGMLIDSLVFSYSGNKLNYVNDYGSQSEGFINTNTGTDDYDYDFNGNLDKDRNKGFLVKGDIKYNFLNRPYEITKGTQKIKYIYDASGRKLVQEVYSGSNLDKYTDYIGEFVYEGNSLMFIQHAEGRAIPDGSAWEYQYHLKDQLGNVRVTFTTKPPVPGNYPANFETSTPNSGEGVFNGYTSTSFDLVDHTDAAGTTFQKVQWLNGGVNGRVGVTKSLSVMPGDKVSATVYGKYRNLSGSGNPTAFATALTAAFGVSSGSTGEQLKLYNSLNGYGLGVAGGNHPADDDNAPKAFVTVLLFDRNYNLLDAAWDQITTTGLQQSATVKEPPHDILSKEVTVQEPGYAYIYLSNEHPTYVDVYFDDLTVVHTKSPIVSSSDYFPFGLTFNSSSRENSTSQDYKYNGKELQDELGLEWLDYGARMYMADIGRWGVVDPLSENSRKWSPYNYVVNNPIRNIDPDGMDWWGAGADQAAKFADREVEASGLFDQTSHRNFKENENKKAGKETKKNDKEDAEHGGPQDPYQADLTEFLQFFFNDEMKELKEMGRLTFYIDSKMKYTTPGRPGDTKSLNDGKRAAISLNPKLFEDDARLLYTIVAHELVHARDILNTNYLQWQFDYIYQSTANDIMEHHAYLRSAAIEAGFGVDYGSAGALQILGPKLPDGFNYDLYNK